MMSVFAVLFPVLSHFPKILTNEIIAMIDAATIRSNRNRFGGGWTSGELRANTGMDVAS